MRSAEWPSGGSRVRLMGLSSRLMARGLCLIALAASAGCSAAKPPPFEWWVDPLPVPPPGELPGGITSIAVLVEHTGPRDDFRAFERNVRHQHDQINRGRIPGFRAECHYLPKLADTVEGELCQGLRDSGWFLPVDRAELQKALRQRHAQWLDLRDPALAADVGRACSAQAVLLVEITDCLMKVSEVGRQTIGTQKEGPTRRTDVSLQYDLRMIDVARNRVIWHATLSRRTGYKLEGPGSMGHWYWPRDPMEFRKALRGQGITEFVLRAFLQRRPDKPPPQRQREGLNPMAPFR